jgi:hypothetical protein
LVDFIKGAVTSVKGDEKMGTVFAYVVIMILNIADVVVVSSGRKPITLMV